jgi:hypothetical protein
VGGRRLAEMSRQRAEDVYSAPSRFSAFRHVVPSGVSNASYASSSSGYASGGSVYSAGNSSRYISGPPYGSIPPGSQPPSYVSIPPSSQIPSNGMHPGSYGVVGPEHLVPHPGPAVVRNSPSSPQVYNLMSLRQNMEQRFDTFGKIFERPFSWK